MIRCFENSNRKGVNGNHVSGRLIVNQYQFIPVSQMTNIYVDIYYYVKKKSVLNFFLSLLTYFLINNFFFN